MLLRRSGEVTETHFELSGIVETDSTIGVADEHILTEIAEAVFSADREHLADVRTRAAAQIGDEALVDAIGIAAGFNGITKVANATGIPLDERTEQTTVELRQATGIDDFSDDFKQGRYG